MRRALTTVAVAAALTFGACATAIPHLTQQQLSWAQEQWPDTGADQLEHGRSLYVTRCSACHEAPKPTELDATDLIGEMADRAHLNAQEQQLVIHFIEASKAAPKPVLAVTPEPARAPRAAEAAN